MKAWFHPVEIKIDAFCIAAIQALACVVSAQVWPFENTSSAVECSIHASFLPLPAFVPFVPSLLYFFPISPLCLPFRAFFLPSSLFCLPFYSFLFLLGPPPLRLSFFRPIPTFLSSFLRSYFPTFLPSFRPFFSSLSTPPCLPSLPSLPLQ